MQAGGSVRGSRVQTGNLLGLWQEIIVCEKEEFIPFLPPSPTPIKAEYLELFWFPGTEGDSRDPGHSVLKHRGSGQTKRAG